MSKLDQISSKYDCSKCIQLMKLLITNKEGRVLLLYIGTWWTFYIKASIIVIHQFHKLYIMIDLIKIYDTSKSMIPIMYWYKHHYYHEQHMFSMPQYYMPITSKITCYYDYSIYISILYMTCMQIYLSYLWNVYHYILYICYMHMEISKFFFE